MSPERFQQIESVFQRVRGEPRRSRGGVLAAACAGDEALRREVQELLDMDEQEDSHLDRAGTAISGWVRAIQGAAGLEEAPDRIAEFAIVGELGRGGMSVVYRARQDSPEREVALKLIRPGLLSPELVMRFEREARLMASLSHPGIAQVYTAGVDHAGSVPRPYIAMELVEGDPLDEHCRRHGLDLRARVELFALVCEAVEHAHRQGVVHRDLKHANILVSRRDGRSSPKVLDFGVARIVNTQGPSSTLLTSHGQIIGTLRYMSPEQTDTSPDAIGPRADVYALGAILYELLVDRPALEVSGVPIHEALRRVREVEPSRPGTVNHRLRGDLDTITTKALAKAAQQRYASAGALADDLRRWLRDEPILARPPTTLYQLAKFARRNRGLTAGLAATFLALVGGLVTASVLLARSRAAEQLARAEQAHSAEELARADAVSSFLKQLIGGVDPAIARGRDTTVLQSILSDAARRADALSAQPEVEADVRTAIAGAWHAIGQPKKAQEQAMRVQSLVEAGKIPQRGLAAAESARILGLVLMRLNDESGARAFGTQAVETYTSLLGPDDPRTLEATINLASVDTLRRRDKRVVTLLADVLEKLERTLGPTAEQTIRTRAMLAATRGQDGEWAEALPMFERALADYEKTLGEDHPTTLAMMINVGYAVANSKGNAESVGYFERVADIRRRILGPGHTDTILAVMHMAGYALDTDQAYRVIDKLAESYAECRRTQGESHLLTTQVAGAYVSALAGVGRIEEALALAEANGDAYDRSDPERKRYSTPMQMLAVVLERAGRLDEALDLMLRCRERAERVFGPGKAPATEIDIPARCAATLARIYAALGQASESAEWQAKAGDAKPYMLPTH